MAVCCCSLAGTAACQHCAQNPFATDVWANETVTVDHVEVKPFGNGFDVCPVCGKPSTIGKPQTNADRFKTMSIDELENTLLLEICDLTGKSEYEDDGVTKRVPLDCPNDCQICLHNWLRQEADNG